MLYLNITPPQDMEPNVEHIATVVRIFEDGNEIINETLTLENSSSILHYSNPYEMNMDKVYTAKVRYIFEPGGMQEESDEFIITQTDTNDTSIYITPPIAIPAPIITTNLGIFDLPITDNIFKINIDTDEAIAKYLIVVLDNNNSVIDKFVINGDTDFFELNTILNYDSIYTIHIIAYSEAGVSSPVSGTIFTTGKLMDRDYYIREDIGDYTNKDIEDLYLHLPDNLDYSKIEYIINNTIVTTWMVDDSHINLRNKVNNNINYKLRVTGYYNNEVYGPIYYNHSVDVINPIFTVEYLDICNKDVDANIYTYDTTFGFVYIDDGKEYNMKEVYFKPFVNIIN